ncbi:obscurin-like protein 1 isoform X1 [Pipistrellus kuhlii]|uniref:Obscurin-like protein 1 n=1 Tax=Pipistrellus kuhlii TaxID=59472 RepID=A0A7J7XVE5_PIPKU|nr:obscurin-like protein 1 isoform X1 [Pipistrellus kuhlii]KAF6353753.1 obscurin like cytoskeletal adaptor 1 [Pipistrellus kuhlii]
MKTGSGDQGSPPCFLRFPRPVRVVSGAEAELQCVVLGEPPPTVVWEKGGQPLAASERLSFPADGAEHGLLLTGALPTDAGVYVCRARNAAGEAYAAAAVTVLEPPGPEPQPEPAAHPLPPQGAGGEGAPWFLMGPRSQWVLRGTEVVLACQVGGLPAPALHWEKDGMALDDVWDGSHFALEPGPAEGGGGVGLALRIRAARLPDSGVYVCHARNAHGYARAGALLQVSPLPECPPEDPDGAPQPAVEPLKCAPKTFWVNEGKHAKFRCYVVGKPEPEIEWHLEGRPLLPDRRRLMYRDRDGGFVLKVLYCQAQDRGLYVCAARNSAGQTLSAVQLHVKEPRLRFSRPLQDVEGRENGIAVLECKVPNSRIPTAWFREDQRLLPCRKYEQIEEGTVRRLIIHRLKADDDGVYLCEMRGRVRTVANVTVKGPILKRLPRKLDVLEGENAVLLVETREAGVEGHWSRDGEDLPTTCQSSSGHMHALVLPGVTREDAGEVTFSLGHSRTTTLLRVKCVKHSPPGPPELAEMFKGRKNVVLLTWKPPDPAPETPFIYRLERQKVGSEDWVQCFSVEKAGAVEVPGDCMPSEGDYRFRICSVSEHGRSPHVVFHGSAHLVPTARLVAGLKDVQVYDGEDAVFSLTLSTIIQGTWFLNGEELQSTEPEGQVEPGALRYCVEHSGPQHRLTLHAVKHRDSGALVGFSCPGVQDSAALTIQESPVHILSPQDKVSLTFTTLEQVVLTCELSRVDFPASWYKDGQKVEESESLVVKMDGRKHRLILPAAEVRDSGEFECRTEGASAFFSITVRDPPVHILDPREHVFVHAITSECVMLTCEVDREDAPVHWYKDGQEVEDSDLMVLENEGPHRRLLLPVAQPSDGGEFQCVAGDERAYFTVNITDVSSWIVYPSGKVYVAAVRLERVVLTCELCRPWAEVRWTKDGEEVVESPALLLQKEDTIRRLVLPAVQLEDSGEYLCEIDDESASFTVTVTEPPVRILHPRDEVTLTAVSLECVVLMCELSREDALVRWYKDGLEVEESEALVLESDGPCRRLVLPAAQPEDGGEFVCDAGDDSAFFTVTVTAPPERIVRPAARSLDLQFGAPGRVELRCEVAPAGSQVRWYKDGLEVEASDALQLGAEGPARTLTLPHAQPEDAGEYVCETRDEAVTFNISLAEPPVQFLAPEADPGPLCVAPGEPVVLSCELSRAGALVCWRHNGRPVQAEEGVELHAEGPRRVLCIRAAEPAHAGLYTCQCGEAPGAPSLSFTVQVAEPPVRVVTPEAAQTRVRSTPGRDLELVVHLSGPGGAVRWYKDGERLASQGRVQLEQAGARHTLRVRGTQSRDAGEYLCDAPHDSRIFLVSVEEPPPVKLVSELTPLTVHEGDDATFRCEVSPPDADVTWLRNGAVVTPGPGLEMAQSGAARTLTVRGCQLKDAGTVTAQAGGTATSARLHIRETELLFLRRLQDMRVEEGQDVCLEVETGRVGAAGAVRWVRGGEPLPQDSRLSVAQDGHIYRLLIHGVVLADQGTYGCESHHDRTLARLSVRPRQLRVLRPLEDVTVIEGGSATFQLELSQEGVTGEWARGGVRLHPGPQCHIHTEGRTHRLALSGLGLADSGCISFTADALRCAARLTVREAPVTFVQVPQDLEVTEGDTATFECELSQALADVTWEKDGRPVVPSPRLRLQALGARRLLQLRRCGSSDAGTYSCVAGAARAGPVRLAVRERVVSVLSELRPVRAREGDGATFECTVSEAETTGSWKLGGRPLRPGGRIRIRQEGRKHMLVLSELRAEDAGEVRFQAGPAQSAAELEVEALPLQMCRRPPREKTVLAGRRAVLEVTVSRSGGHVCWLREGVALCPGDKYELRSHGPTHSLVIRDVRPEDQGTYCCQAGQDSAHTRLLVEGS